MSLDTLANVKVRLGVTTSADDTLLDDMRATADDWIVNHCGRDFGSTSFTEYHPGGSAFIHLRNFPVTSVTSVKVDPGYGFGSETLVPASGYVVHLERGVIQSVRGPFLPAEAGAGLVNERVASWPRGPRVIQVVYAVSATVPNDVLEAYAQLVGHWYRRVKTQAGANFQNVSQQKFGDAWTIYGGSQISGLTIPPDVFKLLEPYRVPNV